jgi:hypothetical protein
MNEVPHWLAWYLTRTARVNKGKIQKFQNIHSGRRCFIVANGPSLRNMNLDLLADEITIGMNRIYLLFDSMTFRPTYYIAMNELILEQFCGDIRELTMPKFLNWNRRLLYGGELSDVYFLKSRMVIRDFFQYDLTRPVVVGATVTFAALQLAFFMGFQEVILVGLDHNYAERGMPSETEIRQAEVDQSHFHPQYFPRGSKWQLPDLYRSEIAYTIARQVFEGNGRKVIDATISGHCQVFEKADYLSLFDQVHKTYLEYA